MIDRYYAENQKSSPPPLCHFTSKTTRIAGTVQSDVKKNPEVFIKQSYPSVAVEDFYKIVLYRIGNLLANISTDTLLNSLPS